MDTTSTRLGLTAALAEQLVAIRYDRLPAEVVEATKLHILDSIGVQLAATTQDTAARAILALMVDLGGRQDATVVGHPSRLPAPHAAFVNATLAHSIELDDSHDDGLAKVGASIVPSALAIAEWSGAKGTELIEAIVAGYECAIRIALTLNPSHRQRGFHTSGTCGTFGAAVASAKLLGLTAVETAQVMGLAAMQAAGIQPYLHSDSNVKPLSPGKAAFNGVLSGLLATRGVVGPANALEGPEGFLEAYADDPQYDMLRGDLEAYAIQSVAFKIHAACRYAHTAIDAAQDLARSAHPDVRAVDRIEVEVSELACRQAGRYSLQTLGGAMGSIPFGVALALTTGSNLLSDYTRHWHSPAVQALAGRIHVRVGRDVAGMGQSGRAARLEVRMMTGQVYEARVDTPLGSRDRSLSTDQVTGKFRMLAAMRLPEPAVARLEAELLALEGCASVGPLVGSLACV